MDRLTKRIDGGVDDFGMPLVSTYEIVDKTPGLANARVRCQLGRYEDTGLTPDEIATLRTENADLRRRLEQRDATQYTHFCPECMERQAEVERLRTAMRKINDLAIGFMEGDGDPKEAFAIASAIYDASDAPRKGETDGERAGNDSAGTNRRE